MEIIYTLILLYFDFLKLIPFKLQERTYPIDFGYKDSYLYSFNLNLGEEYDVVDYPKELLFRLPNNKGQVILKTLKENNTIRIFFKFDFKDEIYNSAYYASLKKYMSTIIDIQNNSLIVLKKKKA